MLRRLFVFMVIAFGVLGFTFGSSPIDGKWKGKMGELELVFTFTVNGEVLTGTVQSPMGELNIANGKVSGDNFTFDVDVNGQSINHVCKKIDETISLKVPEMQGNATECILTRVKE